MPQIGALNTFIAGTTINPTPVNDNFEDIRSVVNTYGVLIDVAATITALHTYSPSTPRAPFALGANAQGQVVTGLTVNAANVVAGSFASGAYTFPSTLAVTGAVTLADDLTLTKVAATIVVGSNENAGVLRAGVLNGGVVVAGGTSTGSGGNIIYRGPSHADASCLIFRADATEVMRTASGAVTVTGTLAVSGATTLSSTLAVTGAATLSSTLSIADNITSTHATTTGILRNNQTGLTAVSGGTATNSGANVLLYGASHASLPGTIQFRASATEILRLSSGAASVTGTLAVSGVATFADFVQFSSGTTNGARIFRTIATDALYVSGGSASSAGGNIVLHGESHATLASIMLFRTGSTERMRVNTSGVTITGTLNVSSSVTATTFIGSASGLSGVADVIGSVNAVGAPGAETHNLEVVIGGNTYYIGLHTD